MSAALGRRGIIVQLQKDFAGTAIGSARTLAGELRCWKKQHKCGRARPYLKI